MNGLSYRSLYFNAANRCSLLGNGSTKYGPFYLDIPVLGINWVMSKWELN